MGETTKDTDPPLVATGVPGLDDVLGGGFTANRLYLVEGNPGSGKTTLALRWLLEGTRRGEQGIYVTLSETKIELTAVAGRMAGRSPGLPSSSWSLRSRSWKRITRPPCSSPPRSS